MENNYIINAASILSKVVLWICVLFLLVFVFILIHWHFDRSAYSSVVFLNDLPSGANIGNLKIYTGDAVPKPGDLLLSELHPIMIYWLLLRALVFFGLTIGIVIHVNRILTSIKNIDTFYEGNIIQFQKMARLGFILFVLSCFNFSYINGISDFHISIAFGPLLFAVSCLVLAEVFKAGKRLLEDKNMII